MAKKKKAKDLTTDEIAKRVFPASVKRALSKLAGKKKS